MKKAKRFVFVKYEINRRERSISFYYRVEFEAEDSETFEEKLLFSKDVPIDYYQHENLNVLLRQLHLILGVSYYKLWCPPELIIENNFLDKSLAQFWNTVYTKGLGEFFYKNQIDYRGLINFPFTKEQFQPLRLKSRGNSALVGVGGGKDSIVAAETVQEAGVEFATWNLGFPVQEKASEYIGVTSISVKRELDQRMIDLSKTDEVYKGHIPPSAIYAFISLLLSYLYGFKYLVFANEKSSDYGNVDYLGTEINHQWSKSREFEDLFRDYVRRTISVDIEYFSLLRPFYEIEIVRRFSKLDKYFHLFSSCNRNFTIEESITGRLWCCKCEKCAFVFALMAAFFNKKKLIGIFGEDLFAKKSLIDTYRDLLGVKDIKPFDCVGTPEEIKVAFHMARGKREYKGEVAMQMFEKEVLPDIKDIKKLKDKVFSYGDYSNIPKK
ncbi:MAG: hypothetical protein ACE5DQ_01535, partial [Candidatus Paceibacterota bacterium]